MWLLLSLTYSHLVFFIFKSWNWRKITAEIEKLQLIDNQSKILLLNINFFYVNILNSRNIFILQKKKRKKFNSFPKIIHDMIYTLKL